MNTQAKGIVAILMIFLVASPAMAVRKKPNKLQQARIAEAIELIGKTCGGQKLAARLRTMLKSGKILIDRAEKSPTADIDGPIILPPARVAGKVTTGPLAFGAKGYSPVGATTVVTLAKTLLHEEVHTHQPFSTRAGSNLSGLLGGPVDHEIVAWKKAITFYKRFLEWTMGPELKKELRPVWKMIMICKFLKLGTDQYGTALTDAQKKTYLRRLIRLHEKYGNSAYMAELNNKMAFMKYTASDMKGVIRDYNGNEFGGRKMGTADADYWLKQVQSDIDYLKKWQKHLTNKTLPTRAGQVLYKLNGSTKPPRVNPQKIKVIALPTMQGGGAQVTGGSGSALPGAKVTVTTPNGDTHTGTADSHGRFSVHINQNVDKDKLKIEQSGVALPKGSVNQNLKKLCETGKLLGALFPAKGILVACKGNSNTQQLYEISITNETNRPVTMHVPQYTQIGVKGGQDGMMTEAIDDTIPAGTTRTYTPATICLQLGVKPKVGKIGTIWFLPIDDNLGAGLYSPDVIKESLDEFGFICVLPPAGLPAFMDRVQAYGEGGVNAASPIDDHNAAQWAYWCWAGAGSDEFEQLVKPQLEKSKVYQQATPKKKKELDTKYIAVPFERIKRMTEAVNDEISIDYTDAEIKACVTAPSATEEQ